MENINAEVALFYHPPGDKFWGILPWSDHTLLSWTTIKRKRKHVLFNYVIFIFHQIALWVQSSSPIGTEWMSLQKHYFTRTLKVESRSPQPKRFFPNQKKFCLILYKASNVFLIDIQHDISSQDKKKWHVTFLSTEIIWIMELPFKIKILNIQDWTA